MQAQRDNYSRCGREKFLPQIQKLVCRPTNLCRKIGATILFPLAVGGASISLHPSADTSLFATLPDNNLGANPNMVTGTSATSFAARSLLKFDVHSQLPACAIIQSASLSLYVVIVPMGGGVASTFELRRVLVDWSEGAGTGNSGTAAAAGDTTWNNRHHPSTPWAAPGGSISNNFFATASAAQFISGIGNYVFSSNSNLIADVQQWLSNPATNFGWVLMTQSEGTLSTSRRFATREDSNNAPILTVEYALPPAPAFTGITKLNDQIQLEFSGSPGLSYTVQYRDSLVESNWLTLTNIQFPNAITNMVVIDPLPGNIQRFYRVVF